MLKRIVPILLMGLSACTPNLETRLTNLEGNQGKLVQFINILAACKADKDSKLPVTTVPCPLQPAPAQQSVAPAVK